MAGHLAALVADTRAYVEECVRRVRKRHGVDAEVVLLLDSVEHIRGTLNNERQVQESVAMLFGGHADKLHLPHLHVVYTVPAYLKVLRPGIGGLYSPGGLELLPAVKVRSRTGDGVHRPGLDALEAIVRARGDWQRLLGGREVLDELCVLSGGDLRDLFRLLREVIASARELPAAPDLVHDAVSRIRSGYLPIADADVVRLARIAETHSASLESVAGLPDFARFLETHLVLCYRNDEDWYDVHPLVADHVVGRARRIREAERAAGDG